MEDELNVQQIKEMTEAYLLNLFNKNKPSALDLTRLNIEKFSNLLIKLNKSNLSVEEALFSKEMITAIKILHRMIDEKDHTIFCSYYLEGKTREDIAEIFEVDVSTIARRKTEALKKLSIILYPEIVFEELFS